MMYVVLVVFFVLVGRMIGDQARSESEKQAVDNFNRAEYRMM